jgi:UDP-glucose 4-epimerase
LDKIENQTVAITGANGYLGSQLVQTIQAQGVKVFSVSRQNTKPAGSSHHIKADIKEPECWLKIVEKADIIFHLAGNTSVPVSDRNPLLDVDLTVKPINHLIQAARTLNRHPKVIFSSTATVYGLTKETPTSERKMPNPITFYDLHKLFIEQQLILATKLGILDGVSLRLSNVYGPSKGFSSSDDRGILNKVTHSALKGKNLSLYGSGDYLRDYIYIDDVVNAFIAIGFSDNIAGLVLNVGSGIGVTIKDAFRIVISEVERITNIQVEINSVPWPLNSNEIELRNFVASNQKIKSIVEWRPLVKLIKGVEKLVLASLNNKS